MVRYSHGEPRCGESSHGGQRQVKALSIALGILAFVLSAGFMHVIPSASAQSTCDYYASPNGTGNGLTPSTPFQISRFWSLAAPGKTLCLLDGIYTGSSSMIEPPDNLSGVAGRPITIKALNDGKVTINGQGGRDLYCFIAITILFLRDLTLTIAAMKSFVSFAHIITW